MTSSRGAARATWECGMRIAILTLFALALCGGGAHASPRIQPNHKDFYEGNVLRGEAFGVNIGDTPERANEVLRGNEISFIGDTGCDYNLSQIVECKRDRNDNVKLYSISQATRHGNLYVIISGGLVKQIVWKCYLLPYIDF